MENKLEIFKNQEFGSVRILQEGEKYLFCAKDVTAALGYKDSVNAIKRHCKGVAKRHLLTEGAPRSFLSSRRAMFTVSSPTASCPPLRNSSTGSLMRSCPASASTAAT